VPSFHHEILVDLFRENGKLAPSSCAPAPASPSITPGRARLDRPVSGDAHDYRADNVAILHGRNGRRSPA